MSHSTQFTGLLLAALALSGCAHRPVGFVGPDGGQAYVLQCPIPEICMRAAGEQCPSGYTILTQPQTSTTGGILPALLDPLPPLRTLSIECKAPK